MTTPESMVVPHPKLVGMALRPRPDFVRSIRELRKKYDDSYIGFIYTRQVDTLVDTLFKENKQPTISAAYFAWEVERTMWDYIFHRDQDPPAFPLKDDEPAMYGEPYSLNYLNMNSGKFLAYLQRRSQLGELDTTKPDGGLLAITQGGLTEEAHAVKLLELQAEVVKLAVEREAKALRAPVEAMTDPKDWRRGIAGVRKIVLDTRFCCFTQQQIIENEDVRFVVDKLMPHYVQHRIDGLRNKFNASDELGAIERALDHFVVDGDDKVGSLAVDAMTRLKIAQHVFFRRAGKQCHARIMAWLTGMLDRLGEGRDPLEFRGDEWGIYESFDQDGPGDDELAPDMAGLSME